MLPDGLGLRARRVTSPLGSLLLFTLIWESGDWSETKLRSVEPTGTSLTRSGTISRRRLSSATFQTWNFNNFHKQERWEICQPKVYLEYLRWTQKHIWKPWKSLQSPGMFAPFSPLMTHTLKSYQQVVIIHWLLWNGCYEDIQPLMWSLSPDPSQFKIIICALVWRIEMVAMDDMKMCHFLYGIDHIWLLYCKTKNWGIDDMLDIRVCVLTGWLTLWNHMNTEQVIYEHGVTRVNKKPLF